MATGCTLPRVMFRHILPSTLAPLAVQATYNCGTAILTEAFLSFLGPGSRRRRRAGNIPTAEGRHTFLVAPWVILIPGCFVSVAILAFNMFGDNLRDILDPPECSLSVNQPSPAKHPKKNPSASPRLTEGGLFRPPA